MQKLYFRYLTLVSIRLWSSEKSTNDRIIFRCKPKTLIEKALAASAFLWILKDFPEQLFRKPPRVNTSSFTSRIDITNSWISFLRESKVRGKYNFPVQKNVLETYYLLSVSSSGEKRISRGNQPKPCKC